ncbi:hypothetical protein Hanom_Chr09g00762581 [Helianthus anomalus]
MATSPHSNPEVAGSSLARSQCPYGSGFTPRGLLGGGLRGGITSAVGRTVEYPPPPIYIYIYTYIHTVESCLSHLHCVQHFIKFKPLPL